MASSRFECIVDSEGRLVPVRPGRTSHLGQGSTVWVSLHTKPAATRSDQANKFLWGVIYAAIAAETGNDPETVHQACKREAVRVGVLPHNLVPMGDQFFEVEPTTVQDKEIHQGYQRWLIEGCHTGSLCGMVVHIEGEE